MTDRELLELAAKAAGIDGQFMDRDGHGIDWGILCTNDFSAWYWNPLTDDGDALRLAVKLDIVLTPIGCVVQTFRSGGSVVTEDLRSDPYAATRRAIVRAAAEIGKL